MNNVIELLQKSNRPVLFIGNGARGSNWESLKNILGIPVLLTWKSMDFLGEDDPLYCGRPGMISTRGANFVLQNADLLICIGTRLDPVTVAYNYMNFAYNAKKIVVDIDQAELDKLPTQWLKINQDAKEFIDNLIDNLNANPIIKIWGLEMKESNSGYWDSGYTSWTQRARELYIKYRVDTGHNKIPPIDHVDSYWFFEHLSNVLDKDDIIVSGSSGVNIEIFYQTFGVKRGQRIIGLPGFGAMGTGLPLAIGVASASKKRVILLDGDGSFQLNIQELETVSRLELPLKIFVFSNGGYGSIYNMQEKRFGRFVGCDKNSGLTLPNLTADSEYHEYHGIWCESVFNLNDIDYLINDDEPFIGVVEVPINQKVEPFVNSVLQKDGTYQIDAIDNMSPYILEKE